MIDLKELRRRVCGIESDQGVYGPTWLNPREAVALLDMLEAAKLDAARIEFLQVATVDIRCVEQGEDSYGWQVIEHHMGTPREKVIGGSFDELGLREAIDAAMAATKGEQA